MPNVSKKRAIINRLTSIKQEVDKRILLLKLYGIDTLRLQELSLKCLWYIRRLEKNRFLFRNGTYRKRESKFHLYLDTDHPNSLDDREFLFHFRMSRECSWELVELIKDYPGFHRSDSDARGKPPKPAKEQLLVLLRYMGIEGNASSSMALSAFFGIGLGAVDDCRNMALEAILTLEHRTYFWPDEEERKQLARRMKEQYFFPHCVGVLDGTLLPLAYRPLIHGETYMSRKKFYAIVMLIVCDDEARILYYHVGWPGSVHDNRVWRNCFLFRNCATMFSPKQYLLGDTAFTASGVIIPPFKSTPGISISNNRTVFNTMLAQPRVKSEHCIGILKGRFPFLRSIRLKLANKPTMDRIIKYVRAAVVLHNFMIKEDVDEFLDEWLEQENSTDDLEPERSTKASNTPDYTRRDELFYYMSELEEVGVN